MPLFVIFKGTPVGKVDKQLTALFPVRILGCAQKKGWVDNRTMRIWKDSVYGPYIASNSNNSGLLLDDFVNQKSQELQKGLQDEKI